MNDKNRLELIADARKTRGVQVIDNDGLVTIKRGSVAVTLWRDGTATRTDVRADLTKNMTAKEVRQALNLPSDAERAEAAAVRMFGCSREVMRANTNDRTTAELAADAMSILSDAQAAVEILNDLELNRQAINRAKFYLDEIKRREQIRTGVR